MPFCAFGVVTILRQLSSTIRVKGSPSLIAELDTRTHTSPPKTPRFNPLNPLAAVDEAARGFEEALDLRASRRRPCRVATPRPGQVHKRARTRQTGFDLSLPGGDSIFAPLRPGSSGDA